MKAYVHQHKYNPQFEIVWSMVAGLLEGRLLMDFFDLLQGAPRDLIGGRHQQILASCLNEARTRLESTVVDGLDAELRRWLHFEMQTCQHDNHSRSMLGSRLSFPEDSLIETLGSVSSWKASIIRSLNARSVLSDSAFQFLISTLEDEDEHVRYLGASALAKKSALPNSVIQSLLAALKDESDHVRSSAASALGNQATLPESVIQPLIAALEDDYWRVRQLAAKALGEHSPLPESAI